MSDGTAGGQPVDLGGQLPATEPLRADDPPRLGEYELLGVLGEGGMGRVYLGRSAAGRLVAVKVIRAELAKDEEYRKRFRTEAEMAKRVPPYCTAEVLAADSDHERPYLVFEYIDGPSLADVVLRNGPLSPANLRGIAIGVAVALGGIHGANVIHRDLKPSNILLPYGSPKVIDFGIARPSIDPINVTGSWNVVGTVPYMAPERLYADERKTITWASDIFAWGAVIAFAGTGRDAFAADSIVGIVVRILTEEPDLTGLTEPLLSLVRLTLAKDPQQRPSAHYLLDLLTQADSGNGGRNSAAPVPVVRARPVTSPAPPEAAPAPQQVSAPSQWFVGRARELAQLTDALCPDGGGTSAVPVAAIVGAGGMGKSWLATRWVQDNLVRFPDGQLYVDLRGCEPGGDPVPPETALAGFLGALGVEPAAIPDDVDGCADLYRSLVADRRMVVVLDNAADPTQVVPLLPGSPSVTVLITSRNDLGSLAAVSRVYTLDLPVLSTVDVRLLLERRFSAEQVGAGAAAVDAIIGRCAGLPLAIGIVAAGAAAHPEIGLTTLAEQLQQKLDAPAAADTGSALRAATATAYGYLPPEPARLFRLLGTVPGPDICLPGAASLVGLPVRRVRRQLRYLLRVQLIEERGPGRFAIPDPLRPYAAERAGTDGEAGEAGLRLVDFYVRTAVAADQLLCPFRPPLDLDRPASGRAPYRLRDAIAANEWFVINASCLLATQRHAGREGWHRSVWQLAWASTTFHWQRGQMAHNLAVWQAGLAAAEQLGDLPGQAEAQRLIGYAHRKAGRQTEALEHMQRALTLSRRSEDTFGMAHAHLLLARIADSLGDVQTALTHSLAALKFTRTLRGPVWRGVALAAVAWYRARVGTFDEARGCCDEALSLHREHGYRDGEAFALRSLGFIEQSTGHGRAAQRAYSDALALYRDLGDRRAEAAVLDRLGDAYRSTGDAAAAKLAWQEALTLYRRQFRTGLTAGLEEKLAALPG